MQRPESPLTTTSLASLLASTLAAARAPPPPPPPTADAAALSAALAAALPLGWEKVEAPAAAADAASLSSVFADPTVVRWRLSVDLRTLRDARAPISGANLVIDVQSIVDAGSASLNNRSRSRAALLVTRPPLDLPATAERLVGGGFLTIEFEAARGSLAGALSDTPIPLQLWTAEKLAGAGELSLGGLLSSARACVRDRASGAVFSSAGDAVAAIGRDASLSALRVIHVTVPMYATRAGAAAGEMAASAGVVAYLEECLIAGAAPLPPSGVRITGSMGVHAKSDGDGASMSTTPDAGGITDAAALLLHPSIRARADALVSRLRATEEAALTAWRVEREAEWVRGKVKAEEEWSSAAAAAAAAASAAAEAGWAEREAARQAQLTEAQERVRDVEHRLRKLLGAAEARFADAERARAEAVAARDAAATDVSALQRRLRADAEAEASAARAREASLKARLEEALEDADAARARAAAAESESSSSRAAASAAPDAALRDALAGADAEVTALRAMVDKSAKDADAQRASRDEARLQVLRLAAELSASRDALTAAQREAHERLRVAFLAREERFVLDGDRATLRDIRRAADGVRDSLGDFEGDESAQATVQQKLPRQDAPRMPAPSIAATTANAASVLAAASAASSHQVPLASTPISAMPLETALAAVEQGAATEALIAQLKGARRALLGSGAGYSASHPWVKRIDKALADARKGPKTRTRTPRGGDDSLEGSLTY